MKRFGTFRAMRSRMFIGLVGVLFAAAYAAEGFLLRDFNQDEFQVATAYLKDRDPSLFPTDFIWSQPEMIQNLHVCVRAAMRMTDALTWGRVSEPLDLFLLWLPCAALAFFFGIYLLCFRFTGDWRASLLAACAFMLVRRVIWDWWGLGPTFTMSARGLVLSLLPLALLGYFHARKSLLRLALLFLGWGIISNLHPLSGWGFVELLGITLLVVERFRRGTWLRAAVMGGMTLLGSAPFLWIWTHVSMVPPELRADPAVIKQFWDGFGGLAAPSSHFIRDWLEDLALPGGLALIGFITWSRSRRAEHSEERRILEAFPIIVVCATIFVMGMGNLLQGMGVALPILVPEHARNLKFIYLTLPVGIAWSFAAWFRSSAASAPVARWGFPIVSVLLMLAINFPGHKLARFLLNERRLLPSDSARRWNAARAEDAADFEVALWARDHTSPSSLFYFDSYEFRHYARRSLVFCWFDRPCVGYRPTRDLEEWIRRRDRAVPLKKAGDTRGMLAAAREFRADYLVLLNAWAPPAAEPAVWSNLKYSIYAVPKTFP